MHGGRRARGRCWRLRPEAREKEGRVAERVAGSAKRVVFSYAKESAEGRQRASQVLEGLELEETTAAELLAAESPRVIVGLEEVEDDAAVAALPERVIRGGATVMQSEAASGFLAFARPRLRSPAIGTAQMALHT